MTDNEQKLLAMYRDLPRGEREALCSYAEFLLNRAGVSSEAPDTLASPLDIARPSEESVVAAMRRLRETYPMLDAARFLHQAAGLLAEHTMQGRSAEEVIDKLEHLFATQYERIRAELDTEQTRS